MIIIGAIIIVVNNAQPDAAAPAPEPEREQPPGRATCERCGWSQQYSTPAKAKQALGGHSRFCTGVNPNISPFSKSTDMLRLDNEHWNHTISPGSRSPFAAPVHKD